MTTPVVRPLAVGPPVRGTRLVTVHCPFCGAEHVHGWPTTITGEPGLYRSHCRDHAKQSSYRVSSPPRFEERTQ